MIISIASGKGGTGKTTLAVNLAHVMDNVQLLDCDVEAPNAHLFLKPMIIKTVPAYAVVPEWHREKCTYCGKCRQVCRYNVLAVCVPSATTTGEVLIFEQLCHGCGACFIMCPTGALTESRREIGTIEYGVSGAIDFISGRLNVGEVLSPKIIEQMKRSSDLSRTVIIDAPPGASCPAIAAMTDADVVVLVTEPTPFGVHDLSCAIKVTKKLGLPCGVVINRAGEGNELVYACCEQEDVPILMEIPFSRAIARAYAAGELLIGPEEVYWRKQFENLAKLLYTL